MRPPTLKTDRFVIRAFEREDLLSFAKYRAHEDIARYQSWVDFSLQDAIDFFNSMDYSNFGAEGNWYQLAIASAIDGELLGDIAVHFIDKDQIEIGFTISPLHQGQDIATDAISIFLGYAFSDLKKHRTIAITDTRNQASVRLLEKLGFRREGHFIENIFFKGEWGDEYLYALLRNENKLRTQKCA
ncbi:putative ribosomal N-acetyltransferase YdaF [Pseudovibrio axinellae]|uniref:Putative ribosomal N-acetyltransferase YdaF n=1 Tax=Pseudovibrio axinellae TaxID=989403 RepID=A0A166A407_9HYPH|nr:GNAT family protein [Pseudovibrio axinellae]KZL20600.1 putative ribosomal N-acetyltransferase YdaF [Pseudovibrio axinellae]SER28210.1 Protein N-acetyltransferase, RimJ/RimL family [Pseudovibrio axinellae]